MKAFFLLLQHRKIAKAKKQAFFKLNNCQKHSQLLALSNRALESWIVAILLANTRKSLKFYRFKSAQILVSLISLNFFCLFLVYVAVEAGIVFNLFLNFEQK